MTDLFSELGYKRTLMINEKELEQRYFDASKSYHPDFHSNKNEQEKNVIIEKSSQINKAYRTLKNTYSRAKHLIELEWVDMPQSEQKKIPPMLLMEVMEMQDKISEYHTAEDAHKTRLTGEIKDLEKELTKKDKQLENNFFDLAKEWENLIDKNFDEKVILLKKLNELINTKKYIGTLLSTIDNELYGGEPITH